MIRLNENYAAAFILMLTCVCMQVFYRPWIMEHQISDFGIAGSSPSFLSALAMYFLGRSRPDFEGRPFTLTWATFLGCSIYECLQQFFGLGTFDFGDILAVLFACLFGYTYSQTQRVRTQKSVSNRALS